MYSWLARSKEAISDVFLREGANEAGAGKVLLCLGGDVGEHGLDALEAAMNPLPEGLYQDGSQRQRTDCAQ